MGGDCSFSASETALKEEQNEPGAAAEGGSFYMVQVR